MQILKATPSSILVASRIVKRGGVIVYPTDTVYGLGCDPFNGEAVEQILKIKDQRKKPLPVLGSDTENVKKVAHMSREARELVARFWPGPITLVLPKKATLPDVVTQNMSSVGVRIPKHEVAIQLIRQSGGLLVGTSANKTGKKPARTAYEAMEQLGKEIEVILDGGPTPIGTPSTVVDLTTDQPTILREGHVSLQEIARVLSLSRQLPH